MPDLIPDELVDDMASDEKRVWAGMRPDGLARDIDGPDGVEPWSKGDARNLAAQMGGDRWMLARELKACRADLKAWETWRAAARSELDRLSFLAHNHGQPWSGPPMPEPTACLPEHSEV